MPKLSRDDADALFQSLDGETLLGIYAPLFDDHTPEANVYLEGANLSYEEVCFVFKKGTVTLSVDEKWDEIIVSTDQLRKRNYPEHILHPSLQQLVGRKLSWVWRSEHHDRLFDLLTLSFDNIDPTIAFYAKASSLESFSLEPTVEIRGELFNRVAQFVEVKTGYPASRLRSNTHLKHNLGLDGDEAWQFIQAFSSEFNVRLTDYNHRYYFKPKVGDELPTFLWKISHFVTHHWWIQSDDYITVQSLVSAAEFGKW